MAIQSIGEHRVTGFELLSFASPVLAQEAAKQFVGELTPGINLGLIAYAGTSTVLVQPTTNRDATKAALDKLQFADRTATGETFSRRCRRLPPSAR